MKTGYEKPVMEIERYELDSSIAANCGVTVSSGPEDFQGNICDEFKDSMEVVSYGIRNSGAPFYDGTTGPVCDCYYSSGGQSYFTS